MPAASEVVALSEAYRQEQARRSAIVAAIVARYWMTQVSPDDSLSWERWLSAVIPAITRARGVSAQLAATYGAALRKLEMPLAADGFRFEAISEVPAEKLRSSLMAVGPANYQKQLNRIELPLYDRPPDVKRIQQRKATESVATAIQGAVVRHVNDGGRETMVENAKRDPLAMGYVRVLADDPCYFCALLASRGAVYEHDSFDWANRRFEGDGAAKTHDHCQCQMKPVYRKTDDYALRAAEYEQMWMASGGAKVNGRQAFSGKAAVEAFRRMYEGRGREDDPWMS